ncbi:MAG: hypothetical protein GX561_05945 [Lentisphaerae bacterium]|jgi:hypothetical protein|nr:hypothetical protein [Lentisphaerota bacterium]
MSLQVGAAQVNITPNLGCHLVGHFEDRIANDINDPLFVKTIVFNDGERTVGLICLDLIDIPIWLAANAKTLIQKQTGVSPDNVIISSVHTHTAPAMSGVLETPPQLDYIYTIPQKIADSFVLAQSRLEPAEIASAKGDCREECHNRRWHMKDGSVKMNPGHLNPDAIKPAGPTDPELQILVARNKDTKKTIAVYANLALHYVGNGKSLSVSADYFGEYAKALQRIAGEDFLVILANGCQGNINNLDFSKPRRTSRDPYFQQRRVANVVAAETWKQWCILREEDFTSKATVDAKLQWLPFHSRRATPEQLAQARQLYLSGDKSNKSEWIYARELVMLEHLPMEYEVPVQSMKIGTMGIAALCGEIFVEFGLDIKSRSPFANTMVVGIANGNNGYVATAKALDEGSYETRLCRHVRSPKGTGELWADTAVNQLKELYGK